MKRNMSVTDMFIEEYKQLRVPRNASFEQRVRFDIVKRRSKMESYESFVSKRQKRLPSKELDSTFDHLMHDAVRRRNWAKEVEKKKLKGKKEKSVKRLSREEGTRMYEKGINHLQRKKARCETKATVAIQSKQTRASSVKVMERMDEDIRSRREKRVAESRAKEEKEKLEVVCLVNGSCRTCLFPI
eukprot:TRINITY_DN8849_c0_g1_i1.p1 TRINITY_DN8849_c0_g1~~TRINITY_DN8849_c0_g1_i1.p1  ORF type:complete len:186 (+),score=42.03 TRINITY_DN8849_c0_g1_i1:140-697(+)